jgi:hypothetical protein
MGYGDIIFSRLRKAVKKEKAEPHQALRIPAILSRHQSEYKSVHSDYSPRFPEYLIF